MFKDLLIPILLVLAFFSNAQEQLNSYKYILVNNKYDFQSNENQYRINEQIVFELKKRNFQVFRNSEALPADFNQLACNSSKVDVEVSKGLKTKMTISFLNCNDDIIYGPLTASSRLKDYEKDFRACVRKIMDQLGDFKFDYIDDGRLGNTATVEGSELPSSTIAVMSGSPGPKEKNIFKTKDNQYTLKPQKEDYVILKNNEIIGNLKKSDSGCYLAITTDFIGIGYRKNQQILIEFEKQGTQKLVFE